MRVRLIQVPYDSGRRGERMGAGPERLLRQGAREALERAGHEVEVETVEATAPFGLEVKTSVDLCRALARRVREASALGRIPVVLSGNCNSSLGALAGLDRDDLGLAWFDAHGDFNTPETSRSGYFDGMAMAMATDRCWKPLASSIPGFSPLPDAKVVHLGGRDFDPEEAVLLQASGIAVLPAERLRQSGVQRTAGPVLDELAQRVQKLYVHVDLDVLDPAEAPVNEYGIKVPGGLAVAEVLEAIELLGQRVQICGGGLAAYDPACDPDGLASRAGLKILQALIAAAQRGPGRA